MTIDDAIRLTIRAADQKPVAISAREEEKPEASKIKKKARRNDIEDFNAHMLLIQRSAAVQDENEIEQTPLFTKVVEHHHPDAIDQYGYFAVISGKLSTLKSHELPTPEEDPRLFFNISAPSSTFICGSQGSGKSHSLSCLLENSLMTSHVSRINNPLAGLLFHYDPYIGDTIGTPCEAAYLSSNARLKVRVLCAPTNVATIRRTYADFRNITVQELRVDESNLTTQRMFDLMAVNTGDDKMPLYLHTVQRILRRLRLEQQQTGGHFNYCRFKQMIDDENFAPTQESMLRQRLDTLESFMPYAQTTSSMLHTPPETGSKKKKAKQGSGKQKTAVGGTDWTIKPGTLTILDLSCPCVTPEAACALFNMCLSMFMEQRTTVGRVIALDEAHKYMNEGAEAAALTNGLLSTIRLQRHLGTRIFISTQEPTISPKLLDLCSITVVHRFTSPAWLTTLKSHIAALDLTQLQQQDSHNKPAKDVFGEIVKLRTGEALIFCPSAIIEFEKKKHGIMAVKKLGTDYLKIKVRERITDDGGRSIMAT